MRTHHFSNLSNIKISPLDKDKSEFRLRLVFRGNAIEDAVEFDVSTDVLMHLMHALQGVQARHKLTIPPTARPHGKPKLRVVSSDDDPS